MKRKRVLNVTLQSSHSVTLTELTTIFTEFSAYLDVFFVISLAQAGATVVDMQVAGRWKSSHMPAHYAKAELAERGVIARFKNGK